MYVQCVYGHVQVKAHIYGDQKATVELVLSFNLYVGSVDQIEVPRLVLQVPLPCPLIYCYHIICIGTHGGK